MQCGEVMTRQEDRAREDGEVLREVDEYSVESSALSVQERKSLMKRRMS